MRFTTASFFLLSLFVAGLFTACATADGDERDCFGGSACGGAGAETQSGGAVVLEPTLGVGSQPVNAFLCTARPAKSVVNPNEIISVAFDVRGGTAPYRVSGYYYDYGFAQFATFWGSYTNTGAADLLTQRSPVVTDAAGRTARCPFEVTVRGYGGSAPNLACTLSSNPTNPAPDQDVTFTVNASGATAYEFLRLEPQPSWTVALNPVSGVPSQARANVRYSAAGARTARAVVRSGTSYATCTAAITVANRTLQLGAAPGVSVPRDGVITVTATPGGFSSAVAYDWIATPASYVSIVSNGAVATIRNLDVGSTRNFTLSVTASGDGGATARQQLALSFGGTATPARHCEIAGPTSVNTGVSNGYTARTTTASVSESLIVTQLEIPGDVSNLTGTTNPFSLRFNAAGTRTIRAKARGASSNIACNGGDWISLDVVASTSFTSAGVCSVAIQQNIGAVGQTLTAQGSVLAGTGIGPFRLAILGVDDYRLETQTLSNGDNLQQSFRFLQRAGQPMFFGGVVRYSARVTDTANGQVTYCDNTYYLAF